MRTSATDVSFFELEYQRIDPKHIKSKRDRVIIKAGELLYKQLDYNGPFLTSVYMPAMVSILYELREDNSAHNGKAWLNGLVPNFET